MAKKILLRALVTLSIYTASMSPCTLSTSNDQILQVAVPNQCAMPQGGTSCGYQAVFNSCAIAKTLTLKGGNFLEALANLSSHVQSRIDTCCSRNSSWVKLVTKMRTTEDAKQQLEKAIALQFKGAQLVNTPLPKNHTGPLSNGEKYLSSRKGDTIERIKFPQQAEAATQLDLLWPECRELARKLAAESGVVQDGVIHYQLGAGDLRQRFKEKLEQRFRDAVTNCSDQSLDYEALLVDGALDQFIEFQNIDHHVRVSSDTTWLKSDEVAAVAELLHKEQGSYGPVFITGHNGIDLEAPLKDDEALKLSPEYHDFVKAFQEDKGSVTGIFLIFLNSLKHKAPARMTEKDPMAEFTNEAEQASSNGHWICLVAHRTGSERLLIIADSLYNIDRTDHYRVKELHALLNGIDYDDDFEAWKDSCRPSASLFSTLPSPRTIQQYSPEVSEQTLIRFLAACTVLVGYAAFQYLQELRSRQPQRPLMYRSPIEAMTVSGVASPLLAF